MYNCRMSGRFVLRQYLNRFVVRQCVPRKNTAFTTKTIPQVPCNKVKFHNSVESHYPKTMSTHSSEENIRNIFNSAVDSVLPQQMIERAVHVRNNELTVDNEIFLLEKNLYVVGFGKAVAGMARTVDKLLHKHIVKGIISVPTGTQEILSKVNKQELMLGSDSKIQIYEGAKDNLPDEDAQKAAIAIKDLVSGLTADDVLLVLVSGGGSALLTLPKEGITLEEEYQLTSLLSKNGATISDLNIVRKHIEVLKGGGLAQLAKPAQVISLIMSDVVGDKLNIIASAPTQLDHSSPKLCIDILKRLQIWGEVPKSVHSYLQRKVMQSEPGLGSSSDLKEESKHVKNVIVGSNKIAIAAASEKAIEFGYLPFILTTTLEGEARKVGSMFGELAKYVALSISEKLAKGCEELLRLEFSLANFGIDKVVMNNMVSTMNKAYNTGKGVCIIAGGETVVHVKGTGLGGRNQELALACAQQMHEEFLCSDTGKALLRNFGIEFLSGATDGADGPTDAAGALVDEKFVVHCHEQRLSPESYLENNDTYNLFQLVKSGSYHIKTGLTGTNVMDVQLLLVYPKTEK